MLRVLMVEMESALGRRVKSYASGAALSAVVATTTTGNDES